MKFIVVSIFPEMVETMCSYGLVGQALQQGRIQLETLNPREFTKDFHKTVDDRPYGGGDGMIMLAEPLGQAIEFLRAKEAQALYVVYMSAQGRTWADQQAREWTQKFSNLNEQKTLVLICGRYGGVDQRFINKYVDCEVSVGDFILTGGELAAAIVIDSMSRFVPGVLGNSLSAVEESFSKGYLEGASFTRPQAVFEQKVPDILLSGDHRKINEWRVSMAEISTYLRRPDLLQGLAIDEEAIFAKAHKMGRNDLEACGFKKEELDKLGL